MEERQDLISRQAAIDALMEWEESSVWDEDCIKHRGEPYWVAPSDVIEKLPHTQLSRIERELHEKTPEEQYKILYQLMFEYANTFNDARRAVIDWLGE